MTQSVRVIKALIKKGIIKYGTLLYGYTKTSGLGQVEKTYPSELLLEEFSNNKFKCRDRTNKKFIMHIENVLEVDGMTPIRLGKVFDINEEGSPIKIGKKRGRKPKNQMINSSI